MRREREWPGQACSPSLPAVAGRRPAAPPPTQTGDPARPSLQAIAWPQRYAREGAALGVNWPRGLLLHGPPGVGKSAAVAAVAAESGATVHAITAASVFGAYTGTTQGPRL